MTYNDLLVKWRAEATTMDRRGSMVLGGPLCREFLADLEAVAQVATDELLTVAQAAAESGYSHEHVARMVREGTIPNAGRRRAPRIRRTDLPRKPGRALAAPSAASYDPATDARDLLSRQRRTR